MTVEVVYEPKPTNTHHLVIQTELTDYRSEKYWSDGASYPDTEEGKNRAVQAADVLAAQGRKVRVVRVKNNG